MSAYVHVPFCARKCAYCAFYSEASGRDRMERYVRALLRELRSHSGHRPRTLFFGGGTPSLLSLSQWERILQALAGLGWIGNEFTIECNPSTLTRDKARLWRQGGVDRVSMGVQTLDPPLLERLGRVHSRERVLEAYDLLRQEGLPGVNLDLMFALPGQTMESWRDTLEQVLALEPDHLSCYEVIYEEDTPMFRQLQEGTVVVDEDLAHDMYHHLLERTMESGLVQYEVANFARGAAREEDGLPLHACRHNANYWTGGEYLGLGPAASGHLQGRRYRNWPDTDAWCRAVEQGRPPRPPGERLPPLAKASETAAFWIRMNRGIDLDAFRARTGFDFVRTWAGEARALVERGWAARTPDRFHLTGEGMRFADAAGAELLRTA